MIEKYSLEGFPIQIKNLNLLIDSSLTVLLSNILLLIRFAIQFNSILFIIFTS
jgi:hypothetical protein